MAPNADWEAVVAANPAAIQDMDDQAVADLCVKIGEVTVSFPLIWIARRLICEP